jgi:hypothetical protein
MAAALGNPRAQAERAVGLMYGLSPPPTGSAAFLGADLREPDAAGALTSLFFAATGGDTWARVALGHKHRRGLGVPRVCATAAMYLQPAAAAAMDALGSSSELPPVCGRLSTRMRAMRRTRRLRRRAAECCGGPQDSLSRHAAALLHACWTP